MRKTSLIFATLLFILASFQIISTQISKNDDEFEKAPKREMKTIDKDDFEKMSFEVELNKTEYALLEPIGIKFRFSNKTNEPLSSYPPNFLTQTSVKISRNNENWERPLYNLSINSPVKFPSMFVPGYVIESGGILQPNYDNKFFTEPGTYQLQFFLSGSSEGVEKISSSVFEVVVKQPAGIDKEALDYLKKYKGESSSDLFYIDGRKNENDALRLEQFVSKYGSSVYGEYAILSLGNFYLFYNDLEKAEAEFEKISSGDNEIIAAAAVKALADVEKCRAENKNKKK